MLRRSLFILLMLLSAYFLLISYSFSDERESPSDVLKKGAPKIFLDCRSCDHDFIKTEITFVNFVRFREEADIHILVTTQSTGAGGTEYTMEFIGQKDYSDIKETLRFFSKRTDTWDDIRKGMVKVLKMGLAPYMTKTPLGELVSVRFEEKVKPTAVEDRWNFWVFSASLNGSGSGEKSRKSFSVQGNFSANRITPEFKMRIGLSASFNQSNYLVDEGEISSYSDWKNFTGFFAKGLGEHLSLGAWISTSSSTYNNIKFAITPVPAVEYNLFPYSQSTRRELRFLYRVGYNFVNYLEETIFDKTKEKLLSQALSVTLDIEEPWGNIGASLTGSHYFHDLSKNRLELGGSLNLRLYRGLFLGFHAGYEAIHDQLSLRKGESSQEDILLRRKELATDYRYHGSIGFSYTFGSVYSNVVNPRFGR